MNMKTDNKASGLGCDMEKWEKWGSFANWRDENYVSLAAEYNSDDNKWEQITSIGSFSFEDFCVGKWQRM